MNNGSRMRPWAGAVALAAGVMSAAAGAEEAMSLKGAMEALRGAFNRAGDGLLVADLDVVAAAARAMSERQPVAEAERVRLIAFLGPQIEHYERIELVVRNTARRLEEAAVRADRREALVTYFRLMDGCVSCHREFREPVAEALAAIRIERTATEPITEGDPQ